MIKIEKINKAFGNHIIFENFSLEIKKNEFVVFTGPSGCGKTTLLNMIGGIEKVDSGKIIVDDFELTKFKNMQYYFQKYVGFLFQNFSLIENKTVEENLNLITKRSRSGISIEDALNKVGLKGKEKQKIFSMSGGEQQRVALARLMLKECCLILADEPTASLDKDNALMVMDILKSFTKLNKNIIMVTHNEKLIDSSMRKIEIPTYPNY